MDSKQTVVYVDGVFDLFHVGHVEFLRKARAVGGKEATLVAGVITDNDARWKRRPIMTQAERAAVVSSCRYVDRVVVDPPLVITDEFLDSLGDNVLVVHGDDSRQEEFFGAAIRRGCMRYVPYHKGVSTSDIIRRIASAQEPNNI